MSCALTALAAQAQNVFPTLDANIYDPAKFAADPSEVVIPDWGRFHLFERNYPNADFVKGMFKTPGIRNIQYTAPYMHNGAFNTLEEVMEFYNHGGALGKGIDWPQQTLASDSLHLSNNEINDVIAFMKSLADTINTHTQAFPLPQFSYKKWNRRTWGGTY